MKRPTVTVRRVLLLSSVFTTGLFVGAAVVGWFAFRLVLRGQIDTDTAVAAEASDALASLRTGDAAQAQRRLEQDIDQGLRLAAWQSSYGFPWYCTLSAQESDQLAAVKYYRSAFPSTQPTRPEVVQLLATVPDIQVTPSLTCTSGYCRIARTKVVSAQPAENLAR